MAESLAEKPSTDENERICWPYDPSHAASVTGLNFVRGLSPAGGYWLPVGFSSVAKTDYDSAQKAGPQKGRWPMSKNAYDRQLLTNAQHKPIPFQSVLSEVWSSAAQQRLFIKPDLDKDFSLPLKAHGQVALNQQANREGQGGRLDTLTLEAKTPLEIYLERVDFPRLLVKQGFANAERRTDIQSVLSSASSLSADQMPPRYRKPWSV